VNSIRDHPAEAPAVKPQPPLVAGTPPLQGRGLLQQPGKGSGRLDDFTGDKGRLPAWAHGSGRPNMIGGSRASGEAPYAGFQVPERPRKRLLRSALWYGKAKIGLIFHRNVVWF
jgi:hypothetical protein